MYQADLVSIIVPAYNYARYLPETIESIQSQTYTNLECLIIDDGSIDNTKEVVERFKNKDSRVHYISQDNQGLSSARNTGLINAKGAYIQFLDADDLLHKDKLRLSLQEFDSGADLVITNFEMLDSKKNLTVPPFCLLKSDFFNYQDILSEWDKSFSIPIHCGMFNRKVLQNFYFNIKLRAKEDWLMWLYVFAKSPEVKFLDFPLAIYRSHETSMIHDTDHMVANNKEAYKLIYELLTSQEEKTLFFERTLELWEKECIKTKNLRNSTSFKIGYKIVSVFKSLGGKK